MTWQNPRTATPETSIWLHTPESSFRQHLVSLESKTNSIPIDPQTFSAQHWLANTSRVSSPPHTLPLETEQQITDDFAFLAAVTEGAQSVAAVCLEERSSPPGITLRFATLDSLLDSSVEEELCGISRILMDNALTHISSSNSSSSSNEDPKEGSGPHFEQLFTKITTLHQTRLLARLRSSKWNKPTYLSKSHKSSLYQNFSTLVHRSQFLYTKSEKSLLQQTQVLITSLQTIYTSFETISTSAVPSALQDLISSSYTFLSSPLIKEFSTRLHTSQKALKPTPQTASAIKTLRQIEKIGSYKRVCHSLLKTSKEYKELFREVKIEYLKPYEKVDTEIGYEEWARCMHVHAEVQLVVYYDLVASSFSSHAILTLEGARREEVNFKIPRTIGTSKLLCYLCYHFLKAHETFFPSRTHGRLYDQWTIPDLAEYDDEIVERYRSIVKEMDEHIVEASEREGEFWRLMPMTSVDSGSFEEVT